MFISRLGFIMREVWGEDYLVAESKAQENKQENKQKNLDEAVLHQLEEMKLHSNIRF